MKNHSFPRRAPGGPGIEPQRSDQDVMIVIDVSPSTSLWW